MTVKVASDGRYKAEYEEAAAIARRENLYKLKRSGIQLSCPCKLSVIRALHCRCVIGTPSVRSSITNQVKVAATGASGLSSEQAANASAAKAISKSFFIFRLFKLSV